MSISDYRWEYMGIWHYRRNDYFLTKNYNLKYPNNYVNLFSNVHTNGIIFSSALLKIRDNIVAETNATIGRDIADKLFLEMHFRWSNPTNFYNAANAYLESSKYYDNGKWYCLVFNTLNSFGLIANPSTAQLITGNCNTNATVVGNNVQIQNVTINSGAVVKVKACNNITIGSGVTVKSGGTLEIEAGGSVGYHSIVTVESGANFINH